MITPGSRFVFVDIVCRAQAPALTAVTVGYDYTALSPASMAYLEGMTEKTFAVMTNTWRQLIETHLLAVNGGAKR